MNEKIEHNDNQDEPPKGIAYTVFGLIGILVAITILLEADIDPLTIGLIIGFGINFFLWFWLMKVLTDIRDSLKK